MYFFYRSIWLHPPSVNSVVISICICVNIWIMKVRRCAVIYKVCPQCLFLIRWASSLFFSLDDTFEKQYGETVSFKLKRNTHALRFFPTDDSESVILWKSDDPSFPVDTRVSVSRSHLEIQHLTQKDSGRFQMIDRHERHLASYYLQVSGETFF